MHHPLGRSSHTYELRKTTHVDSSSMDKLSESYVARSSRKRFSPSDPTGRYEAGAKDLLYAFVVTCNPWRDSNSIAMFHQEFEQALQEGEVFKAARD